MDATCREDTGVVWTGSLCKAKFTSAIEQKISRGHVLHISRMSAIPQLYKRQFTTDAEDESVGRCSMFVEAAGNGTGRTNH
jgi:hypothetical protein